MLIIFGAINMDLNATTSNFPAVGQTVKCLDYVTTPGGKAANQALAAARAGAKTALVGKVGDDGYGNRILVNLRRNEVMTSGVATSDNLPTGLAMVIRDTDGGRGIVLASGANTEISSDQVPDEILGSDNMVVVHMDVDPKETLDVVQRANKQGARIVLNLSPFKKMTAEVLALADYILMNEETASDLCKHLQLGVGASEYPKIARALAKTTNTPTIITLAEAGSLMVEPSGQGIKVPALKFDTIVDSTGAGACYCGTLSACLYNKMPMMEAMKRASVTASLSCLKIGTYESYPYLGDVEEHLSEIGSVEGLG